MESQDLGEACKGMPGTGERVRSVEGEGKGGNQAGTSNEVRRKKCNVQIGIETDGNVARSPPRNINGGALPGGVNKL